MSLTAVGIHAFAGLMTRGVQEAGFRPLAILEDGKFGGRTHARNFPSVKIHNSVKDWPIAELAEDGVDLVYGQPACAGLSILNTYKGIDNANNCGLQQANDVGLLLRPRAFVVESVTNLWKEGLPMVEQWERQWHEAGYNTTRLTENAMHAGTPQARRRALFVAAQANLDFTYGEFKPHELTVRDAIGDLDGIINERDPWADRPSHDALPYPKPPQNDFQRWARGRQATVTWNVVQRASPALQSLVPHVKAGCRIDSLPETVFEETYFKIRVPAPGHHDRGKPSRLFRRLDWDKPCTALTGGTHWFHPTYDRFLSVREKARCMGVPDDYVWDSRSKTLASAEIGKAVCPPVASWVAAQIAWCLADPSGRLHRSVVDLVNVKPAEKKKP